MFIDLIPIVFMLGDNFDILVMKEDGDNNGVHTSFLYYLN